MHRRWSVRLTPTAANPVPRLKLLAVGGVEPAFTAELVAVVAPTAVATRITVIAGP